MELVPPEVALDLDPHRAGPKRDPGDAEFFSREGEVDLETLDLGSVTEGCAGARGRVGAGLGQSELNDRSDLKDGGVHEPWPPSGKPRESRDRHPAMAAPDGSRLKFSENAGRLALSASRIHQAGPRPRQPTPSAPLARRPRDAEPILGRRAAWGSASWLADRRRPGWSSLPRPVFLFRPPLACERYHGGVG